MYITPSSLGPNIVKPQLSSGRFWPHGLYLKQSFGIHDGCALELWKPNGWKSKRTQRTILKWIALLIIKVIRFYLRILRMSGMDENFELIWPVSVSLEMGKLRTDGAWVEEVEQNSGLKALHAVLSPPCLILSRDDEEMWRTSLTNPGTRARKSSFFRTWSSASRKHWFSPQVCSHRFP